MRMETYASVWDAVADSPDEARDLELRAELMDRLEAYTTEEGITRRVAARRLGVSRSRVRELVNGRISKFTIYELVNLAAGANLPVGVSIRQNPDFEGLAYDKVLSRGSHRNPRL